MGAEKGRERKKGRKRVFREKKGFSMDGRKECIKEIKKKTYAESGEKENVDRTG